MDKEFKNNHTESFFSFLMRQDSDPDQDTLAESPEQACGKPLAEKVLSKEIAQEGFIDFLKRQKSRAGPGKVIKQRPQEASKEKKMKETVDAFAKISSHTNAIKKKNSLLRISSGIDEVLKLTDPESGTGSSEPVKAGLRSKLMHFFIPHEGNGYRPHALHPGRLAFWAGTSLAVKIILVALLASYPYQAWLNQGVAGFDSRKLISSFNKMRAEAHLSPLSANSRLDQAAFLRAQELMNSQMRDSLKTRSGPESWLKLVKYDFDSAAENIAVGYLKPDEITDLWKRGESQYSNILDKDADEVGIGIIGDARSAFSDDHVVLCAIFAGQNNPSASPSEELFPDPHDSSYDDEWGMLDAPESDIPYLANFKEKNYLKENALMLEIKAPNSDYVALYADNFEYILKNAGQDAGGGSYQKEINLGEGQHSILIKSARNGKETYSIAYLFFIDTTPPQLDRNKTDVRFSRTQEPDKTKLSASVFTSSDTRSAKLIADKEEFNLAKDEFSANRWTGSYVFDRTEKEIRKQGLDLAMEDIAGNSADIKLSLDNPALSLLSLQRYSSLKNFLPADISILFRSADIFYIFFLVLAVILLGINIFVEVFKQHYGLIFSSIGFIFLLSILILT